MISRVCTLVFYFDENQRPVLTQEHHVNPSFQTFGLSNEQKFAHTWQR